MLTIDVTKSGCFYPGNIRLVSESEGKSLIEAGAAVLFKEEIKASPKTDNKKIPEAENKDSSETEEQENKKDKSKKAK